MSGSVESARRRNSEVNTTPSRLSFVVDFHQRERGADWPDGTHARQPAVSVHMCTIGHRVRTSSERQPRSPRIRLYTPTYPPRFERTRAMNRTCVNACYIRFVGNICDLCLDFPWRKMAISVEWGIKSCIHESCTIISFQNPMKYRKSHKNPMNLKYRKPHKNPMNLKIFYVGVFAMIQRVYTLLSLSLSLLPSPSLPSLALPLSSSLSIFPSLVSSPLPLSHPSLYLILLSLSLYPPTHALSLSL